ncbi:MAG: hypothetical protein ACPKOI_09430 [Pleomorphochaeta sp.]
MNFPYQRKRAFLYQIKCFFAIVINAVVLAFVNADDIEDDIKEGLIALNIVGPMSYNFFVITIIEKTVLGCVYCFACNYNISTVYWSSIAKFRYARIDYRIVYCDWHHIYV